MNFIEKLLTRKERKNKRKILKQAALALKAEQEYVNNEFRKRFPNTKIVIKDLVYDELDYLDIGENSYSGAIEAVFLGENNSILKIGKFCSIADQVKILLGGQHPYKGLTTYPICVFISENYDEVYPNKIPSVKGRNIFKSTQQPIFSPERGGGGGDVEICDDVWIGTRVTILGKVKIGQGAIIGAGATITKDVEPYSIVVGNNQFLKYRFDKEIIDELITFADYSKINIEKVKEYSKFICTTELTKDNIKEFRKFFE